MAQTARCPSCGAPVEFKSAASVLAVCDYCRSTLIRQGEDLANLGRMAALLDDRSPLQRGAEGVWRGRPFGLIGRIQLRYEQGLWNEWHLLFDDGKSGWLSEAGDEYVMSELKPLGSAPPPFANLEVGQSLRLNGRPYTLTNLLKAECVGGEGELPFKVGAGYPAPVADLRDEAGGYATLDYSESEERPIFFEGEAVDFESLRWNNLRQDVPLPNVTVQARAFDCPSCGAPLKVDHTDIKTIGCGSCGALLDPRDERVKLLERASDRKIVQPTLALGTKGKLRGEDVEIVGYMRRRMRADGVDYRWGEYLLLTPQRRQLWLTESDGHWNIARVLSRAVKATANRVRYDGREYKHFQSYRAHVDYVIGQFPWRVSLDDEAQVDDFVAPPFMLSQERTTSEVTWTLAEYVAAEELTTAFALKTPLPPPFGIYANQPNPYEAGHRRICRRFWRFAILGLALHLLLLAFGPGGKVLEQQLTLTADDDEPRLTGQFVLDGRTNRLKVSHDTTLNNNWVGVAATLVNQDTGENWHASREIGYYQGVEDGESWSEGSRSDEVVFADLPPGHYVLAVETDMDTGAPGATDRLTVRRAGPSWFSLLLLLAFLASFPIYTRIRHFGFETRRWAESDHPIVTSGGDGGGGDDE